MEAYLEEIFTENNPYTTIKTIETISVISSVNDYFIKGKNRNSVPIKYANAGEDWPFVASFKVREAEPEMAIGTFNDNYNINAGSPVNSRYWIRIKVKKVSRFNPGNFID